MNAAVTALKVLVAVVIMASAPLALRRRWRLFLAVPLAVIQGFVPWSEVAGTPIPLAFWGGLMLWPEFVREFRAVVTWKPTAYILGVILLFTASLLWSVDRKTALESIGYPVQFLVIFSAVVAEGRRDERFIYRLLQLTAFMGLLQAVLVIGGRLSPALKFDFFLSPTAKFFISPNELANFFTAHYNTLAPQKSGGMFTNANVGSAFLGELTCIAFGLALCLRSRWMGVVAALLLAAVAFAGSKAGLILSVLICIVTLHAVSVRYRKWRVPLRTLMVAVVLMAGVAWLLPRALEDTESTSYLALKAFSERSDVTLSTREVIWNYASIAFAQHPFRGLGFGGWEEGFQHYARRVGVRSDLPPHNTIIITWANGGLLAALLAMGFIYEVLRLGWRQIKTITTPTFGLSLGVTMAFAWTFAQGMGENFGLLGEKHMSAVLAALLAILYLQRTATKKAVAVRLPSPEQDNFSAAVDAHGA